MDNYSDDALEQLVRLAATGDRPAFDEIVRRTMQSVIALTYRMTGERDTALDLAQETFLAAWNGLANFRGESKIESWLYRIAANKSLNHLEKDARRRGEPVEEIDLADDNSPMPDIALEREELRGGILAFMSGLPPRQRIAFELRFYREMTFEEIARTTGSALGSVKTNFREAIKKLRDHARQEGWVP